jgi:hypothetical protein
MKINFKKTYDKIPWEFLQEVKKRKGLPHERSEQRYNGSRTLSTLGQHGMLRLVLKYLGAHLLGNGRFRILGTEPQKCINVSLFA